MISAAVMDLSPINTPVVKVHAGDCDMPGFGEVMYDIQGTTFTYYADTPESESGSPVPEEGQRAFGIDPNSGQVHTQVEDFRPFYRGWFSTSVRATARNNNNLKANANLKVSQADILLSSHHYYYHHRRRDRRHHRRRDRHRHRQYYGSST